MEDTFGEFEKEGVQLHNLEDVSDSGGVGCKGRGFGGNGDVVHVSSNDGAKGFVFDDSVMVNGIHHGLEGGRRVSEAKEHNHWFVKSVTSFEGSLPFVTFIDTDVVVPPLDIQFGVDVHSPQIIY